MADDPHAPFDNVTLTTEDGQEHYITRLFEETEEEKAQRRSFYDTTPSRLADEQVDLYTHSLRIGGALPLKRKLDNLSRVTVTLADADGKIIATGIGEISAGFKPHKTKEAFIMERAHTAKLVEE